MDLEISQSSVLVDDVGVVSILAQGGEPKFAQAWPEVLVDLVESPIDESSLNLMDCPRSSEYRLCCRESEWSGHCEEEKKGYFLRGSI